jgi:hypothetical protein
VRHPSSSVVLPSGSKGVTTAVACAPGECCRTRLGHRQSDAPCARCYTHPSHRRFGAPVCATILGSSQPLAAADLPLPPTALIPSIKEPSIEDSLPALEIRLHIGINVVFRLNLVEEARSLSIEEQSLCEFLLDQILFLQESLELWLVPRIIEELLGREKVAGPPLDEAIPSPPATRGARSREGPFPPLFLHRWEPRWWFIS